MKDLNYERICACALLDIFGYRPRYPVAFVKELGSASAVFEVDREKLWEAIGPCEGLRDAINDDALRRAEAVLKRTAEAGCRFVAMTEPEYPRLLAECDDAPVGLFVRCSGDIGEALNPEHSVAVVGTRDISSYGRDWCRRIVRSFVRCGASVTSGLAFGVDVTAHLEALENGIPTVAVIPTGIDTVYPSTHSSIADRIASTPGCAVVTDFLPGTPPMRYTFLRRNRLIAGMSHCTVVVESKLHGGAMVTAGIAWGYARGVFALPGRIDDIRSAGCLKLIREGRAEAITSKSEMLKSMGLCQSSPGDAVSGGDGMPETAGIQTLCQALYKDKYPADEAALIAGVAEMVESHRGITAEEIGERMDLPYRKVSLCVGILENDGILERDLLQRCSICHSRQDA